ncbi:MAG: flagellar filament capping protein FliD [Sedimentisphaerales bacterium]|nr:flagellar filament capping protein FliD [Sedimentisphaerales bacterium]
MSTLRLPGLFTGIDTNTLIAQLMAIERRRLNTYEDGKKLWEQRKEALSTLQTKLDALRSTARSLSDARELRAFAVASSDSDILTAEASYNSFEGNHTVVINRLANAERWVHTSGVEYSEDRVGAGTFIYSYNHKETVITTTAATSLEDLVGLINNDADNPGVTASLLFYSGAYHLVLNGNEAGTDYRISVNASNTEMREAVSAFTVNSDNATLSSKIVDLDQFGGSLAAGEKITISGKDHNGNAVSGELSITSDTKLTHLISEINDAFDGRATATLVNGEIRLTDHTCGTSKMELTLSYNPGSGSTTLNIPTISRSIQGGSTTANLTGFASADFAETQSAQDSKIRVDGYPSSSAVSEVQKLAITTGATAGTFTLTYDGHTTAAIAYDATTAQIQAALEALPNVSTGEISVGGASLTVNNGTMTFTFSNALGDVSLISINPSGLTPSVNLNYIMTEQTKGSDGWISRSSNTVDNVISGVTLHLHDTTDANGQEITLTRDIESVKEKLNSMVAAYNAAVVYIQEKTGYNDILKTAGVLMGDYIVSTVESQLNIPLIAQTSGFVEDIDTFLMPGQIGLELDRDGVLTLDANAFDEAIAKNYIGVLAVIGADKTGSTNSNAIQFYSASSNYTRAGTYDVQVTVAGVAITGARIKLATESSYRDATYSDNIVTGNSSFDENGDPMYPENGLALSVDLSQNKTFTATVRVKQGFTGALEDALDKMLKLTTGSINIDQEYVSATIKGLQERIELEESRLVQKETRLVNRFTRLERTLALLQNQMAALGFSQT